RQSFSQWALGDLLTLTQALVVDRSTVEQALRCKEELAVQRVLAHEQAGAAIVLDAVPFTRVEARQHIINDARDLVRSHFKQKVLKMRNVVHFLHCLPST